MPVHAPPETVISRCRDRYGTVASMLDYGSPFELLVAVILSAQTTDAQVNRCTPDLFRHYPDARSLAGAALSHVESLVKSTGFYHTKARNIIAAAACLVERHGGMVPSAMDELVLIPGVGRKSAGVVLHHVYGQPAIIVDTHFGRVCRRLGMSAAEDPVKVERDVAALVPRDLWSECSMLLNLHGRRFCTARSPRCSTCFLLDLCPSAIMIP